MLVEVVVLLEPPSRVARPERKVERASAASLLLTLEAEGALVLPLETGVVVVVAPLELVLYPAPDEPW